MLELKIMFCRVRTMPEPFMEHPTGEYDNATEALANAISRLRALPGWSQWITFSAQGLGQDPNSYHCAEVRMLGNIIELDNGALDTASVCKMAGLPEDCLTDSAPYYVMMELSASESARLLDAIFRVYGRIVPFPDEGDDYAVGAEW
jgi:hypothetical protein